MGVEQVLKLEGTVGIYLTRLVQGIHFYASFRKATKSLALMSQVVNESI